MLGRQSRRHLVLHRRTCRRNPLAQLRPARTRTRHPQHPVVAVDDPRPAPGRARHLLVNRQGVRQTRTRTRCAFRGTSFRDPHHRRRGRHRGTVERALHRSARGPSSNPPGARSDHGSQPDRCRQSHRLDDERRPFERHNRSGPGPRHHRIDRQLTRLGTGPP